MATKHEEPTRESFFKDVAKHELTVLLEQGIYRHLRLADPATSNRHFNIVTWPGYLSFSGDMGSFEFWRLDDMFQFFRGDGINPGYWAEKVTAQDRTDGIREYDEERFIAYVLENSKDWPDAAKEEAKVTVLSRREDEREARGALSEFSFGLDGDCYEFSDSWEANFSRFTYRFIWCCYAVQWAVQQYDAQKEGR